MSEEFSIIPCLRAVLEDAELPSTATCIAIMLMLSAGENGETAWKQNTIADRFNLKERQVRYILARLESAGYIKVVQRGKKLANLYLMPWHSEFSVSGNKLPVTEDPDQSDRQKTAAPTGKKMPVTPAKNCRSIYEEVGFEEVGFKDSPTFDLEAWCESRYARHAKKGHRVAAQRLLSEITAALDPAWRAEFERIHELWIGTERWRWKGGAAAPYFDEWLLDEGWRYEPSPEETPEARRQRAIDEAWDRIAAPASRAERGG
ncbi:MAG TPA: helix-turn-helix domain-containing protein [Bryobacteraceae bacterium]|nr:helix-turn-helix domain-containing protein [Bryobacteraceae bacterium]